MWNRNIKKSTDVAPLLLLAILLVSVGCQNPSSSSSPSSVAVTGVSLTPSELSLVVGSEATLIASITPENASDPSVMWASGASAIASVSSAGVVTALAVGEATITVTTTDGSYTDACVVTVTGNTTAFADDAAFEATYGENGINQFGGGSRGGTVVSYTKEEWESTILPAGGAAWIQQYLDATAFAQNDTDYRFGLGQHTASGEWVLIFGYTDGTYRDFVLTETQVNAMIVEMDGIFDGFL